MEPASNPSPEEVPASKADPNRWVDEHGDCLYRYALVRVRTPEVAEDLVQETLIVAVRSLEKFAGRSSERSFLVGILKTRSLITIASLAGRLRLRTWSSSKTNAPTSLSQRASGITTWGRTNGGPRRTR